MPVRQLIIAIAAAAIASAAAAEPPKAPVRSAAQPAQAQPPVGFGAARPAQRDEQASLAQAAPRGAGHDLPLR